MVQDFNPKAGARPRIRGIGIIGLKGYRLDRMNILFGLGEPEKACQPRVSEKPS